MEEQGADDGSPVFLTNISIDSFDEADLEELAVRQVHHSNIEVANRDGQTRCLFPEEKNKQGRAFISLQSSSKALLIKD